MLKRRKKVHLKKRKKYFFLFMLVFFIPVDLFSPNRSPRLIVWYVGQGQMVTYSDIQTCIHFDMGGEVFPIKKLVKECGQKTNQVFFSHWDWDHVNFTRRAWKRLPSFCRLNRPGGEGSKKRQEFLLAVPLCEKKAIKLAQKIFREIEFPAYRNRDKKSSVANKYSRVVVVKEKVLIPGDSPGSSETLWLNNIKAPVEILVVSHHGSRYSTTDTLLKYLPYLKIAVVSARRKRYGHPHPIVKNKLANRNIPLLSTEEFNHIHIPL